MEKLTKAALQRIIGGTYYGNGVHCGKKTCSVNWGQARNSIGKIVVNGWVQNGPWAHK